MAFVSVAESVNKRGEGHLREACCSSSAATLRWHNRPTRLFTGNHVQNVKCSDVTQCKVLIRVLKGLNEAHNSTVLPQSYFPELLWPTKKRRNRRKFRNKEKSQRQRFKVSQDGKGGRSANS